MAERGPAAAVGPLLPADYLRYRPGRAQAGRSRPGVGNRTPCRAFRAGGPQDRRRSVLVGAGSTPVRRARWRGRAGEACGASAGLRPPPAQTYLRGLTVAPPMRRRPAFRLLLAGLAVMIALLLASTLLAARAEPPGAARFGATALPLPAGARDPAARATVSATGLAAQHPATPPANSVVATIPNVNGGLQGVLDPDNGNLYVPSGGPFNGTQNLTVISTATNQVLTTIGFGQYANLQVPTFDPANQLLYVPDDLSGPDNVSVVNCTTNTLVENISTGLYSEPMTGLYDPSTHDFYVPSQGDANLSADSYNLSVIDTQTNTVAALVKVGIDPQTPALDPQNGYLYVPNEGSNNLSIVSTATDRVVATIGGLNFSNPTNSYQPLYDPVNHDVYVPNPGGYNVTVLANTTPIASIFVGPVPSAPGLDPANGYVYVTDSDGNLTIISPDSNTILATNPEQGLVGTPIYDALDDEIYAPGDQDVATGLVGSQSAFDPITGATIAIVAVGQDPSTGTLDTSTQELYSVNNLGDNVSVIWAGVGGTINAPHTYSVTFTETGLPDSYSWQVQLNATTYNVSVRDPIVFRSLINDSYSYSISHPYTDYFLASPNPTGQVAVHGANQTILVTFGNLSGGSGGSGGSPAATGFLGLPGDDGYLVLGVIVLAVVGGGALVALRSRRPPTFPGPPGGGYPRPPPSPPT